MFKRPIILPLIVLILAIILVDLCLPTFFLRNHYTKHTDDSLCFKYLILDSGKRTPKTYAYTAKVIGYYDYEDRIWKNTTGKIKLYIPLKTEDSVITQKFHYGDVIVSTDKMMKIKNMDIKRFNYVRFMRHKRIYHQVFINSFRLIEQNRGNMFVRWAQRTNQALSNRLIFSGMGEKEASLATALLLGNKNEMNSNVKEWFSTAGIAHILCVSGLHIMLIVGFLMWVLKYTTPSNTKWLIIRNLIAVISAWLIAFIVGFTPSALRVAFMLTLLILSKFTPLSNDKINILFVTAFVFLVCDPLLLFDISFQLSFLAVLGIYTMNKFLYNKTLSLTNIKKRFQKNLIGNLCTTTSAQMFTLPVILIDFGRFPIFFLLTNLVVVPLMQVILVSLIVLLIIVDVPLLGNVFSYICNFEMDVLMFIAQGADFLTNLVI